MRLRIEIDTETPEDASVTFCDEDMDADDPPMSEAASALRRGAKIITAVRDALRRARDEEGW